MENQRQEITAEDVVRGCVQELSGISVPAGMIEQIGLPIMRTIHNLRACIDAWDRQAAAEAEAAEPEIMIEPVEGDENAD